jgi:hypothetical protein
MSLQSIFELGAGHGDAAGASEKCLVLRATAQQAGDSARGHLPLRCTFPLREIGASISAASPNTVMVPSEIQVGRRSPTTTARRPLMRTKTVISRVSMRAQAAALPSKY